MTPQSADPIAATAPRPLPRRIYDLLYLRVLPHTRPDDLCVLIFSLTVTVLFFTVDRAFEWAYFIAYLREPVIYFSIALSPILLIVLMEERYNLRRSSHRFVSGLTRVVRDTVPFIICIVIYLNMADVVHLINPIDRDPALIRIDQALFGVQPSQWMERFSSPWLDEWMHFAYIIFGWYPFTLGLFFLVRGQRRAYRDLLLAFIMASLIGYLGYVAVPAVGPRYYLEYTIDLRGQFFASVEWAMKNTLYINRDCFPSLHTANTLVVLLMAWRHRRVLFWFYLPFCASTVVSTMYLRYHYGIDVIAGALLAAAVVVLAPRWNARWDAWTARIQARGEAPPPPAAEPQG
jgi:membrane-associated phospholipid phosphatase